MARRRRGYALHQDLARPGARRSRHDARPRTRASVELISRVQLSDAAAVAEPITGFGGDYRSTVAAPGGATAYGRPAARPSMQSSAASIRRSGATRIQPLAIIRRRRSGLRHGRHSRSGRSLVQADAVSPSRLQRPGALFLAATAAAVSSLNRDLPRNRKALDGYPPALRPRQGRRLEAKTSGGCSVTSRIRRCFATRSSRQRTGFSLLTGDRSPGDRATAAWRAGPPARGGVSPRSRASSFTDEYVNLRDQADARSQIEEYTKQEISRYLTMLISPQRAASGASQRPKQGRADGSSPACNSVRGHESGHRAPQQQRQHHVRTPPVVTQANRRGRDA